MRAPTAADVRCSSPRGCLGRAGEPEYAVGQVDRADAKLVPVGDLVGSRHSCAAHERSVLALKVLDSRGALGDCDSSVLARDALVIEEDSAFRIPPQNIFSLLESN